jgi:hypothetical protein
MRAKDKHSNFPCTSEKELLNMNMDKLRQDWNQATANLQYGVQRVFVDVLTLVQEEKKKDLVWGQDYGDGGACLVNAAGNMLTTGGGQGIPMANFGEVVSLFDRINREFRSKDINTDYHVSPLAAEILLQWFAPLKEEPVSTTVNEATSNEAFASHEPYVEATDEEIGRALMEMFTTDAPVEMETPFDNASIKSDELQS